MKKQEDVERDKNRIISEWTTVNNIVQRGGSVEIKGNKDGSWKILETQKRIVKAS